MSLVGQCKFTFFPPVLNLLGVEFVGLCEVKFVKCPTYCFKIYITLNVLSVF